MAKGFKARGGGADLLNFRVIGGTSAPADPKENTIWVNTEQKITSWDLSAAEPQRRSSNRNLLVHPYDITTNVTSNGITFKPYAGGTVGVSGTATAQATCYLNEANPLLLPPGTYTFSGAVSGATASTYVVGLKYSYDGFATALFSTTASSNTVTFDRPVQVIV